MIRNNRLSESFWIWTSVLLVSIHCQKCPISYEDLKGQWYLKNREYGYDMNVLPAWRDCINGTGVTVGVVDTGVENHPYLNINRHLDGKYARMEQTQYTPRMGNRYGNGYYGRMEPIYRERQRMLRQREMLKHGTRVAGIIAAKINPWGFTGIAFGAQIADIRIASKAVFESFDAASLAHKISEIDVYSCSFANSHTGTKSYPLLKSQENALKAGIAYGRHGLGSVYVFATGNSGGEDMFSDSCAYDRLVTNRYVIAVAGIQGNLQKLPNGEACSAMMVAAFTSYPSHDSSHKLRTTDINNGFTVDFDQNSAAVPMVSGAVALALDANPRLGYRDIMHLLVNTAKSDLQNTRYRSYFTKNAAGFNVSSHFGFGFLDIGSLVERSKMWRNVPLLKSCRSQSQPNQPIHQTSNNFVIYIHDCPVTYIEHIEVSLRVQHQNAGQIQWVLMSPYATRSIILPGRGLDRTTHMDITVLTVQMWGENPNGYWSLKPTVENDNDDGILEFASLTIYGHTCQNLPCLPQAQQVAGRIEAWSNWGQCTATCGQGKQYRYRQCRGNRYAICSAKSSEVKSCNLRECPPSEQTDNLSDGCPSTRNLQRLCAEQCSTDSQCWGDMKCCFNGCGHTCVWTTPDITSWGSWSEWSLCTQTCGGGEQHRTRHCNGNRHTDCYGERFETETCNSGVCPVHRHSDITSWGLWSEWSLCTQTCGGGEQHRTRHCNGNRHTDCYGERFETQTCNSGVCPVHRHSEHLSDACPSTRNLQRVCAERCSNDSECRRDMKCCFNGCGHTCVWTTPGSWDLWSDWSPCTVTCGQGTQSRTRHCQTGGNCNGEYSQHSTCTLSECPISGRRGCNDEKTECPQWVDYYGCKPRSYMITHCRKSCKEKDYKVDC